MAYGLPLVPEKIEPGNKKTIVLDVTDLVAAADGSAITTAFVVDKIDRRFLADAKTTEDAIANVTMMLEELAGRPR